LRASAIASEDALQKLPEIVRSADRVASAMVTVEAGISPATSACSNWRFPARSMRP